VVNTLVWFVIVINLPCLNLNPRNFGGSILLSVLCGETCLLVSWCVGAMCGMVGSDEDRGMSKRFGAKDWWWSSTDQGLDDRTIERSGDAVCGLHRAQGDEELGFLGLASKPRSTVSLGSASNLWLRFLWFCLKTTRSGFPVQASKTTAVV
jgi:hypothetical protein